MPGLRCRGVWARFWYICIGILTVLQLCIRNSRCYAKIPTTSGEPEDGWTPGIPVFFITDYCKLQFHLLNGHDFRNLFKSTMGITRALISTTHEHPNYKNLFLTRLGSVTLCTCLIVFQCKLSNRPLNATSNNTEIFIYRKDAKGSLTACHLRMIGSGRPSTRDRHAGNFHIYNITPQF